MVTRLKAKRFLKVEVLVEIPLVGQPTLGRGRLESGDGKYQSFWGADGCHRNGGSQQNEVKGVEFFLDI